MSNVKDIFKGNNPAIRSGEPNEALVQILQDCLEMAKSGDLHFLTGTGFILDGTRLSFNAGHHERFFEVIGAIEELKREYIQS